MNKYSKSFINWVKELLTEEQGQEIASQGITYLEILYENCTGKKAIKNII